MTSAAMLDETERLRALAAYKLADTAPEADFDRFATIAADLLGLPIGLVNLVGAQQLTVKGRKGVEFDSLPREIAFCAHTILGDEVLAIPDLALDARFATSPLVTEGGLRFYAGAPLISPLNGQRIGTLCVAGHTPRPALDARETRLLQGLATLALDRMELRRAESGRFVAESNLRYLAHHDTLTGCANRARLVDLIDSARTSSGLVALVLLDLDGFKHVNDTFGHGVGDGLLRQVGERFTETLAGRGMLARLGGDEFAVLLPGCAEPSQAVAVARALLTALNPPAYVAGRALQVGASAGIASVSAPDAATLLPNADLALYEAKAAGRGTHRTFEPRMREEYEARRELEEEVGRAAISGQFELHYQPQISLRDRALVGAEALLRWRHPDRGLLPPAMFLTALEAGPFAGVVGDWAVEEACSQAAYWRGQGLDLRVGVNLFAEQMRAGGLEATVRGALERWKLPPSSLELELTETIALRHDEGLLAPLHALHARGVGIAFDDFGTGYASLSTLKRCPLTRLKIDRGFVSGLGTKGVLGRGSDRDDVAIIEAVLALARGLGLGVVAEGVETEGQALFLGDRGCDEGQGYLYGRPAPAILLSGAPKAALACKASRPGWRLANRVAAWAAARLELITSSRKRRRNR